MAYIHFIMLKFVDKKKIGLLENKIKRKFITEVSKVRFLLIQNNIFYI